MRKFGWLCLALCLLLMPAARAAGLPADGQYIVEAALRGGSGRASIASPAELTVQNGAAMARVVWSSPHYEHMIVGGETYSPVQKEGNSTFLIPVALDEDIPVSAQTVAMSQPHVIEYTLRFDSKTLRPLGGDRPLAGILPWGLAALVLILACAAFFIARRGKHALKGQRL